MLEFNGTFIVLAISFVIFVILENFIFYRPLKKVMTQRADYIKGNELSADENYSAVQTLLAEKNEKVSKAREKASNILNDSTIKSQQNFDEEIKGAKAISNINIEETKKQMENEKAQLQSELKKEIGIFASEIISKILKKEVSVVNVNDEIVEKAIKGEYQC